MGMTIRTQNVKVPIKNLQPEMAAELRRMERVRTAIANRIVSMPKEERLKLRAEDLANKGCDAVWMETLLAQTKTRANGEGIMRLPLELGKESWRLYKDGHTFVASLRLRGNGKIKNIPLQVDDLAHKHLLMEVLHGQAQLGNLILTHTPQKVWYASMSVFLDIPDREDNGRWVGVDRGERFLMVAAAPNGSVVFWESSIIRHIFLEFKKRREALRKAGCCR